jgi:hypothetical protein
MSSKFCVKSWRVEEVFAAVTCTWLNADLIWNACASAGEFAEEVGFVHTVLEGFAAVDEDDGDFVGELVA